jgi:hypothetical protein
LSIASNIQWYALIPHKAYSFITTLFLVPFDDVITKFYCIYTHVIKLNSLYLDHFSVRGILDRMKENNFLQLLFGNFF